MPLKFMTRPQADISLHIEGESFAPGDEVKYRASVGTRKGFEVRKGWITLECIETYWVIVRTNNSTSEDERTRRVMGITHQVMRNRKVRRGLPQIREGSFKLPENAPLSVNGEAANIQWRAKLSLDVPGRRDLHEEQPLIVRGQDVDTRDEYDPPVTGDERFDDFKLRLEVSNTEVTAGDLITGRLRIDPLEDCGFSEVRVEIERQETAGERERNETEDRVVLASDVQLRANRSQEWGFSLTVPDGLWPSTAVSETLVKWRLKAILARSLRRDHAVQVPLRVR